MIEKKLLDEYDVETIIFLNGESIFEKGNVAKHYFQIVSGAVKMNYYNEKGNEFIQGIFGKNKSFGEPPLLIDEKYPSNAISIGDSTLFRLKKEAFKLLLLKNNDVHYQFTKMIAKRLYFKATMANGIASNSAEEAILTLF
jgi:CRP-like cAMP-binding protein